MKWCRYLELFKRQIYLGKERNKFNLLIAW